MIKINLIEKKKRKELPKILGVDLGLINIRPIVLIWFMSILIKKIFYPQWDGRIIVLKNENKTLNKEYKKILKENKNKDLQGKLNAYESQIVKLKERVKYVQRIIDQKVNVQNILLAISRETPDNLWINYFEINKEKKLQIKGESISYRSIGDFIKGLNQLKYFQGTVIVTKSLEKEKLIYKKKFRLQVFELEGKIVSFGENN